MWIDETAETPTLILTQKPELKGRFFAIAQNDERLYVILNGADAQ